MALLAVEDLSKRFYGVAAVDGVSFEVQPGEIVAVIGPNGSGKTTLFNCVTGFLPSDAGDVYLGGARISAQSPAKISVAGIRRTFQDARVFGSLSVLDNLRTAVQQAQEDGVIRRVVRTRRIRSYEAEATSRADELIEYFGLMRVRDEPAESLSYGQRKLLNVAAALMSRPQLVLLDEPAAAVNPTMVNHMIDRIRGLNEQGQTFVLIEHNMHFVMGLADRVVVLDHGVKIAEGTPDEVREDPAVLEAYLG